MARITTLFRRAAHVALLLCCLVCGARNVLARDAFVMLSGGHSPMDNNYSQYLQAKAVVTYFERNYPRDSIWVFFGAGNVEGENAIFGDVRREVKRAGLTLDSWLAGSLSRNRPARRDVILRALREEILPAVANGGTLYLFVGDHGSQTRGTNAESIIDLWGLERDTQSERGWRTGSDESLSVSDLRRALSEGIGKGRVVFCMTQCHSGGFHHLAVPREMTANPKWFTSVPDWAVAKQKENVLARAAGFTATDERSLAAGCEADPDPERWAGYERFIPENLLGMNLFTLDRTGRGLRSFAEAHAAATLVDRTIDKPYSTSEQYLERWANLIETRLAKETNLTETLKRHVAAYQRAVDGVAPKGLDLAFRERQALFQRFTERLAEHNPAARQLLLTGTRKELEQAIAPGRARGSGTNLNQGPPARQGPPRGGRRGGGAASETAKLWNETVRPAWKTALESDAAGRIVGRALEFENYLLSRETTNRDFFSTGARSRLQDEAFWRSGYHDPHTLDVAKAEAVILWGATRRSKILDWAKTCDDEAVRDAAVKLVQPRSRRTNAAPAQAQPPQPAPAIETAISPPAMSKRVAAERVLFYRRVLAAWEFLLGVNERSALTRLRQLTELERTPLPLPASSPRENKSGTGMKRAGRG